MRNVRAPPSFPLFSLLPLSNRRLTRSSTEQLGSVLMLLCRWPLTCWVYYSPSTITFSVECLPSLFFLHLFTCSLPALFHPPNPKRLSLSLSLSSQASAVTANQPTLSSPLCLGVDSFHLETNNNHHHLKHLLKFTLKPHLSVCICECLFMWLVLSDRTQC